MIAKFTLICPPYLSGAINIKAFLDKSICLPFTNGPLSVTLTSTDFPVFIEVTLNFVPKGNVL